MLDIRAIRAFQAVAEERSFTRAAHRLNVAQPALSRQMRELEAGLDLVLFDRGVRPVALTAAGRVLLEHGQRILAAMVQLHGALDRVRQGERRKFTIGFVGSTMFGLVPDLLRRFRAKAPDVDIDLIEMNTVSQIEALKSGRIDAGLGRLTLEDANVARRVIQHEALMLAVSQHHALAVGEEPVNLAELVGEKLILYPAEPRPSYADQVLSLFHDHALSPVNLLEARELQSALGLVSAEAGVSIIPASVAKLRRDDIVYRPIRQATAVSPIILSWRMNDSSDLLRSLLAVVPGEEG
ncbi:LysR substrate-binding domain-containing protein [Croceicoccus mobilis]|uniref:LysR family transcriptional regulator n=1 Tax=Croceicoccus mobilis TaxID=1703339 RepID=A0A916Z3V2_9SPHN|nr:LysR substrate-binding domain-containing protein [Croceicoccus mobilis]GGD74709.1 LysR family transcriptional regulator [Croceicoccus mobilis]